MPADSGGPPPVLAGGRVLEYATLDHRVTYAGHSYLFVDGEELGPVPCLAICQPDGDEVLLLHCDAEWHELGVAAYASVAQAKRRAERIYPGVGACWLAANVVPAQADHHLRLASAGGPCSFCGRRPEQVVQLVEGRASDQGMPAWICDGCVARFHDQLGLAEHGSDP